jgi:hypothetical protein
MSLTAVTYAPFGAGDVGHRETGRPPTTAEALFRPITWRKRASLRVRSSGLGGRGLGHCGISAAMVLRTAVGSAGGDLEA